ncbi:MAG: ATP-binding cassette domain-containing protein [Candidatus Omnitrophica bacterium]|nr:ATP-binding cassette domain-containing protein [Candidatus Omnitrophota bacterium]MBU0896300.1 ATP-binding cassette domain-containing protein [Candidatus Omnitrophota bacterium]
MITINNLSKGYGGKTLFEKLSLAINQGEKIGLIGPNGAGKTTLFSMILGEVEPSAGSIQIKKGLRIGYLPQEASFKSNLSVLSEVVEGDKTIMELLKEKEALEIKNKAATSRYGDILHELEFLGFFDLEHKAEKVLMGLGFKESDLRRPVNQMSGGFKMRALLAKILTCHYDILLLDEPTNFLDLNAALWLESYLSDFKGTFVMISHDKDFLNEVTRYTLILEHSLITKVKGNYEDYQKIRQEQRSFLLKAFKEQEKKRRQLEKFVSRFHAQPNKASQVRAKKKVLEKMEKIVLLPDYTESIRRFHFPKCARSGYRVMALEKISKYYGDIEVYRDLDFEVIREEKAVLAGENGAGKSTLLKILAGVINVDKGLRVPGHNANVGYFSQERMEVLNPLNTVFAEGSAAGDSLRGEDIRTILGTFLFTGSDVDKKVSILSGGEKSRLILAKLLMNPPNFLLLDEPTTHLDIDATDALIRALREYEGTLVFISHDIHFVRSVANTVFEVKSGRVKKFPGDFDYYWQRVKDSTLLAEYPSNKTPPSKVLGRSIPMDKTPSFPPEPDQPAAETVSGGPIPMDKQARKSHNTKLAKKIKELRKEKEKEEIQRYAKRRVLSNPYSVRSEAITKEYSRCLKEIEEKILKIDKEIKKLEPSFFPE